LKEIAEQFIGENLQLFQCNHPADEVVIQAINDTEMNQENREERVLRWLHYYRVLLFFADESRNTKGSLSKELIISEYEKLRERIRHVAPLRPTTGKRREVTSLTSKALWCCYPYSVPIFDGYALRALHVISRLSNMTIEKNSSEYARFVDAWFQVYAKVEPVIELAHLDNYSYKVRVLDKFLWFLGQPNFETTYKADVSD
jgi:hypothetical protein